MNQQIIAPQCTVCGAKMFLREKDGSRFWGCQNWKECGGKTIPYYKKEPPKPTQQTFQKAVGEFDQGEQILKGLREIYKEVKTLREEFKSFTMIFTDKNKNE